MTRYPQLANPTALLSHVWPCRMGQSCHVLLLKRIIQRLSSGRVGSSDHIRGLQGESRRSSSLICSAMDSCIVASAGIGNSLRTGYVIGSFPCLLVTTRGSAAASLPRSATSRSPTVTIEAIAVWLSARPSVTGILQKFHRAMCIV